MAYSDAGKSIPNTKPPAKKTIRPWGDFEQYAHNQEVTVSLMRVKPGKRLSLQSHSDRAELWIVLDNGAIVQVENKRYYPSAGEKIWIPVGAKHRLSSNGPEVRVLEVAFGIWQQDDIVRYEDDFSRPKHGE